MTSNIDWFGQRLNVLEDFEDGEFVLAQRIKFVRKIVNDKKNPKMYTVYTRIFDQNLQATDSFKGQIICIHGFSQNSDAYFEIGLQFALNGFIVHLVDLEGFGESGGSRIQGVIVI